MSGRTSSGAVQGSARRLWRNVAIATLTCVAATSASVGLRVHAVSTGPVAALATRGAQVTAQITLTDDPKIRRHRGGRFTQDRIVVPATLTVLQTPSSLQSPLRRGAAGRAIAVNTPVVVFAQGAEWSSLLPSQSLEVTARLAQATPGDLIGAVLLVRGPPRVLTSPSWIQAAAGTLRAGLRTAADILPADQRGLLPGLVVGDVSRMDPQLTADLNEAGLSHLNAVSGANLAIVASVVLALSRLAGFPLALRAVLAAIAMIAFAVVARPSPSVLRALLMGLTAAIALGTGRAKDGVAALSASILLLILFDPELAHSYGFALSVFATAGILLLAPRWRAHLTGPDPEETPASADTYDDFAAENPTPTPTPTRADDASRHSDSAPYGAVASDQAGRGVVESGSAGCGPVGSDWVIGGVAPSDSVARGVVGSGSASCGAVRSDSVPRGAVRSDSVPRDGGASDSAAHSAAHSVADSAAFGAFAADSAPHSANADTPDVVLESQEPPPSAPIRSSPGRGRRRLRLPRWAAEAVAVSAAAQVAVTPVLVLLSGQLTLVAIPANLLAGPAVAPATILGFVAALVAPIWPQAAQWLVIPAGYAVGWIIMVAQWAVSMPLATLPWPGGLPGLGLLVVAVTLMIPVLKRRAWRTAALTMAGVALVVALVVRPMAKPWPPPNWLMVVCDVGQGDGMVLAAGPGRGIVVDTGPDPVVMDRCLRRLDVRDVPLLLLTHPHADHVDGLPGVLRNRRVGAVIVSPQRVAPQESNRIATILARHRIPEWTPLAGSRWQLGPSEMTILAPDSAQGGTEGQGEGSLINNSSVVARVRWRAGSALLSGDIETEAQDALLRRLAPRADVLKVPHHGSRRLDPAFFASVGARAALISVGADNDYGHPAPSTIGLLHRLGARVYRTDRSGDLAVIDQDGQLAVVARGP
ncbi:ComEC/Rec2 family competence protein [Nonomuraea aurantiaca]|uniref:ComEC/Rec2 family competence protein n=1 Tax=Nonomuraea aurantiaca TaxID=2878562 RepID=UPI001CD92D49|nr:ComEC/Rec2 family competence protein [Nonomuraea aurantiaca]MCA2221591.1 ComEC/Rec2 family competence protein [Nonomuraea aurantiaca]